MEKRGMYKELARYYDLIYWWKDYKKESNTIRKLIKKYKKAKGNSLLEVACGTGKHLEYLKKGFSCTGLDLNREMLKLARKRVHGVKFIEGNMVDFSLDRKFDAITCLFSAIGYVKTYENLEKTLDSFSRHLKPGGVVIIEPWFTKTNYKVGSPSMVVYQGKDIKIARAGEAKARNGVSTMEMHYLISERGKRVKYFTSREELGLFEVSRMLRLMKKAGLRGRFLKSVGFMPNHGMYVGVKPI